MSVFLSANVLLEPPGYEIAKHIPNYIIAQIIAQTLLKKVTRTLCPSSLGLT